MITWFEIPTFNYAARYETTLPSGKSVVLSFQYRDATEGGWILDINRSTDGTGIVQGIPLVTGVDLLEQYGYLGFGGQLIVFDKEGDDAPTFDSLGSRHRLYFGVDDGT